MTRVLVLAAHPDDAELAVGGSIARWSDSGIDVTVAFFSASESRPALVGRRVAAAEEAATILGHRLQWLADPAIRQVEQVAEFEVVELIDKTVAALNPDVVIGHWPGDSHGDHVRMARATSASSRRWPTTALLQFGPNEHRVLNYLTFVPNIFLPIAGHEQRKKAALRAYSYDGQGFRDLDLDGAHVRNAALGSLCGLAAAEGLYLARCVGGSHTANALAQLLGTEPSGGEREHNI
ncbi:PIG-L family deacetylase [Streptomyces sp. NPDC051219]|uniref:PIG-L deacetylase family protein n=1 Tax=Streptomyces sp. NPDC051219 TaxID=3155283 RepID=UPI003421FECA